MNADLLKRIAAFATLCLVQALVLNQIHLFDCATPLLYVYMVAAFPCDYPKWAVLLWAFLLGVAVDTFTNTPGVAAASLTAVAAVQPYFLALFIPADAREDIRPNMAEMGALKYCVYIVTLVLLHCLLFFSIEMFSFFNLLQWAECVLGSAALTVILILTLESVRTK